MMLQRPTHVWFSSLCRAKAARKAVRLKRKADAKCKLKPSTKTQAQYALHTVLGCHLDLLFSLSLDRCLLPVVRHPK
jgi:hypothetical protein